MAKVKSKQGASFESMGRKKGEGWVDEQPDMFYCGYKYTAISPSSAVAGLCRSAIRGLTQSTSEEQLR